jgi:hypothetical protein
MTVTAYSPTVLKIKGIHEVREEIPELKDGDEVLQETFFMESRIEINYEFKRK